MNMPHEAATTEWIEQPLQRPEGHVLALVPVLVCARHTWGRHARPTGRGQWTPDMVRPN